MIREMLENLKLYELLMYGSGLCVMEVVLFRYHNIEDKRLSVTVRNGKGNKQRITTLYNLCLPLLTKRKQVV